MIYEVLRKICGVKKLRGIWMNKILLRWYGHVECLGDDRLIKNRYRSGVEGTKEMDCKGGGQMQ